MKCSKCQTENPETNIFCRECGTRFSRPCPGCGADVFPEDKFCGKCGHNLALPLRPSLKDLSFDEKIRKIQKYLPKGLTEKILAQRDRIEGELKQVTVMFCDMEGFTPLVEKLGPEEAYALLDKILEILIHKVHDYEGTVNKMTGDGVMALFGAPIALEDAPQRAIRSAHAIHQEMVRFSDKLKQEKGLLPIKMRIGINTGPVVIGTLGNDLRVEFTAVGDTVNLASRMEGLAEPGTTYVSEDTFKLTEGFFRFEALGEKEIKGKEQPVKVYRVIAPSTRRTRFDVSAERGLTPFVGRERELELLLDGFWRVKEGRGQAFSIMGEAGVGKSRLLYEFRKAIANEDVTFLEGKCLSYGRGVTYHPIIDILKSNFDIQEGDGDIEVREKVKRGLGVLRVDEASTLPYFLELLSVKDSGIDRISMSPEARKDRIIEALKQIILKGSGIRPLVMAIEDLHWIDKISEEALKYTLESIPGARVMLIFTYRPEFVHTWGGRSYHNQINLNRLSNRESLFMVTHLLGTQEIDRDLEKLILEKTEGVPFFIEELLKSLRDLKIIERKDGKYQLAKDVKAVAIPSTIQDMIMARVDSLSDATKTVLQTGSVIEREFPYDLIKRVTGLPEQSLLTHLSALKDSELLYERGIYPQTSYIFRHALTREVAYNSLLVKRRKEIHERIGKAIEELYSERLEEFYEMLAYHYSRGEVLGKASQYLKLSGSKAARNHSLWEAYSFYKEALATLKRFPETVENKKEKLDVLVLMVTPMIPLSYPEGSLEILQEGESLSKELTDNRRLALFRSRVGHYYTYRGNHLLGLKYSEDAFEEGLKSQDIDLIAPLAWGLCASYFATGQHNKIVDIAPGILDLLEKAERKFESFALPVNPYSWLCGYCGMSMGYLGNFEEGKIFLEKALRHAAQINDLRTLGVVEFFWGNFFFTKGDWKPAIDHFQNCIKYSEKVKYLATLAWSWAFLGNVYSSLEDPETGRRYVEEGLKIQRDAGFEWFMSFYSYFLGDICLQVGDLKNARSFMDETLRLSQKNNEKLIEGLSWIGLGRILERTETPQIHEAEEYILQGMKIFDELKLKPSCAWGYWVLGELYANAGLREKALENLKKAETMFQEMGMDYWLAKTRKVLAEV